MEIEFDPEKDARNRAERGLPFLLIVHVLAGMMGEYEDTRRDYGEARMTVFGLVNDRLLTATYTRRGDVIRVISLRKANERERRKWLRRE